MDSVAFRILEKTGFPQGEMPHIDEWRGLSMWPLYPWGHWTFRRLLKKLERKKGNVIEAGVGMGGTSLFLASWAQNCGKKVYSLDTFNGLPKFSNFAEVPYFVERDYSSDSGQGHLLSRFKRLIRAHKFEKTIVPVPGVFPKSFRRLSPRSRFCFAHIDADLYSSTLAALKWIYPRTARGGILALDDFLHQSQGVSRAVADFFNSEGVSPVLHVVFPTAVFIEKGERPLNYLAGHDGHIYSFSTLRSDRYFKKWIAKLAKTLKSRREKESAQKLLAFLNRKNDSPNDIYEYLALISPLLIGSVHFNPKRKPIKI